jgi:hypothetical protein
MGDWTHVGLIRGGRTSGEGSGDGRWRSSGCTAVAAQIPGKCRRGWAMTCAWELKWVLGKSYGSLVCLGSEWIKEFTGSANGGRRRVALAREEVRKGSFIALGARRGGCSVASWPTVATTWRGGGWRHAAPRWPMAGGGFPAGVCAQAACHRPRPPRARHRP